MHTKKRQNRAHPAKLFMAFVLSGSSTFATAALSTDVGNWFDQQAYSTVTPAGSFQTQAGRMYTGGGISARSYTEPVFDFVNIQSPKISAGCGGIDIYTGGFTYIDADQFKNSIRAIGQNAQSLAFMMAIKIVTPQLEDLMNKIKGYADKFNQFQTDSCQAASSLLEMGTQALGWTENCISLRMETKGEDRSTALNNCTTGGKGGDAAPASQPKNKVAFIDGNLAWYVLMQDPYFRNDLDMAELMMNVVGTVIMDKGTGSDPAPRVLARTRNLVGRDMDTEAFKNIFNAIYLGSKSGQSLNIYKCDSSDRNANTDSCKALTAPQNVPVNWLGIKPRIDALLASITKKVISGNGSFSAAEIGLIESTKLPIYRFISAATASDTIQFTGNENPAEEFGDIVAREIVLRNIKNLVAKVQYRIDNDKQHLGNTPEFKEYSDQLASVLAGITQLQRENEASGKTIVEMQNRIVEYERKILPKIAKSYLDAAKFSG